MQIRNSGVGNVVDFLQDNEELAGCIEFRGNNSSVAIAPGCSSGPSFYICVGSNCSVMIGERCTLANIEIRFNDGANLDIGRGVGFTYKTEILAPEASRISIGYGSLFATETIVATSDFHSIFDAATDERINPAADIIIGPEVWLGLRAVVLKGSHVGAGSVIGLGSIVSGLMIPPCSLAAGVPAKVLRNGVRWTHRLA